MACEQVMEASIGANEQANLTVVEAEDSIVSGEDMSGELTRTDTSGEVANEERIANLWASAEVAYPNAATVDAQANEMRTLLRAMRMTTSQMGYTSEEGAEGIARRYGTDGGLMDIVEQLTDMAGRLQLSIQQEGGANAGRTLREWDAEPFRNRNRPEYSETELLFLDMDVDVKNAAGIEKVASIFGGGNLVRDIRQSGTLTFVAFWTSEGANKMLAGGILKLRKAGIHVATVSRARFREDLHLHEVDPRAPAPYYYPFKPKEEGSDRAGGQRNVRSK